jgi:hypothetical protein
MNCYVLRWRGGDSPYGAIKGWAFDGVGKAKCLLSPALSSYCRWRRGRWKVRLVGSVRVSGVWVGARKLEGELDVGGRRIL